MSLGIKPFSNGELVLWVVALFWSSFCYMMAGLPGPAAISFLVFVMSGAWMFERMIRSRGDGE